MIRYLLIAGALFLGLTAASMLGVSTMAAAVIPVPVGIYLARGEPVRSLGVIVVAGLSALVSLETFSGMLYYCWMAMVGIPLGLGISGQWSYTRTAMAMAAMAFGASLMAIVLIWPEWVESCRQLVDLWITEANNRATDLNSDKVAAVVNLLGWIRVHWPEIGIGIVFWSVLIQTVVILSLTQNWVRRRLGLQGLRDWFGNLRPSEWLVWGVIAIAILWFIDRARPELVSRVWLWNAAIGLTAMYWLGGLAIMLYALEAVRPHMFIYVGVIMLLMMSFWVHPMLCVVGLFDTWGDFRHTIDRMVAARKKRFEDSDHTDNTE